jgi:hypothetical protein
MSEAKILENIKIWLQHWGSGYGTIEWKNNKILLDPLHLSIYHIYPGMKCTEAQFDEVIERAERQNIITVRRHMDEVGLKMSEYRIF